MADGGIYVGRGDGYGRRRGQRRRCGRGGGGGRNFSSDSNTSSVVQGQSVGRKYYFSSISKNELEALYSCSYKRVTISMANQAPSSSSRTLRTYLMGRNPDSDGGSKWRQICDFYAGLFSDGVP